MEKDTMGIEEYELQIDYFEELKKVQERVSEMPETQENANQRIDEDGLDDDYLMDNIMQGSADQQESTQS